MRISGDYLPEGMGAQVSSGLSVRQFALIAICWLSVSFPVRADVAFLVIDAVKPYMVDPFSGGDISPLRVGARAKHYSLSPHSQYLADPSGQLTIEDVASADFHDRFVSHHDNMLNFGITADTYWIKFQIDFPLQNLSGPRNKSWLLELGRAQLDVAELYVPTDTGFQRLVANASDHSRKGSYHSVLSVFPIAMKAGDNKTFYLRVASHNALFLPLSLWSEVAFVEKTIKEEYLFGAFFGAMLILVFYNLCLYFSVSEKTYLYHALTFLGFTVFQFIELGHGFSLFGNNDAWLSKFVQPYLLWFTWATLIFFTRHYLNTATRLVAFDFVLRVLLVVEIVHALLSFAIDFHMTQMWLSGFSIFVMLTVALIGYRAWLKGDKSAFLFLVSWLAGIVGGITYVMVLLAVLPSTPLYLFAAPIGMLVCSVLLSYALTDRIRRMRNQALEANKEAVSSLSRYESLFNNAVEGMYRLSTHGRIVSANPALAHMLGFNSVEQIMAHSRQALATLYPQWQEMVAVLSSEGRFTRNLAYEDLAGKQRWASHTAQVILDERGEPSHIEGTFVDISERIERELAEKEREKERLEKEMAAASAQAKSAFLANMSHEIRTPLTAIIGYSDVLSDPALDERDAEHSLDTVIRSGHHLLELINDIMDFSRIEAQQLEVQCHAVDIFLLLKDVESYFLLKAQEKGIDFTIDYQYPLPSHIMADQTRLRQILLNLCSNAIKFTAQGGVTVSVSWSDAEQLMTFAVKDTGIGMSEAQCARMFKAYSQADASTTRQFGGTGLGLVISKQLAELMGGNIVVSSEQGKGSCFTATIGGGVADQAVWLRTESDIQALEQPPSIDLLDVPLLQGRILVAEDNPESQTLIRLLLYKTGVDAVFVENGFKAVELLQRQSFDLVIMDMHMPVMNGMDATQAIRKLGNQIPVIAISAGVMGEDIKAYEASGCTDVLAKPIDRAGFYGLIKQYLHSSRSAAKELGVR